MNRVILCGRLGKDSEGRVTQGGNARVTWSIATNRRIKRADEWVDTTDWHNCVMWGTRAEKLARHLIKGAHILVEGRLHTRSYEDQQGQKRYRTEVVVEDLEFCGPKPTSPRTPARGHDDGDADDFGF